MSHLIPEARVDKNGKTVIRHVLMDESPAPSVTLPPPALATSRNADLTEIRMTFQNFAADDYMTEMGFDFDYPQLSERVTNLNDLELARFKLYLNHTEEESAAFLMPLVAEDYDLLSDMTLIYDHQRHGGPSDDEEEYDEFVVSAEDIYQAVAMDHEGMKRYMKSQGVNYVKLDLLSQEDRTKALKWIDIRHEAEKYDSSLVKREYVGNPEGHNPYAKMYVEFTDPRFLELAITDDRVMEFVATHNVTDVERIELMLAHEKAVAGGVL